MGLIFLRHAYSRYFSAKAEIEPTLPKRGGQTRPLTKEDFSGRGAIFLRPNAQFDYLAALRQMLRVGSDYVAGNPAYDHFAGATLVPQLVQFSNHLDNIRSIGGDTEARLRRLTEDQSSSVDATIFELLVAGRCVELGRNVEFIPETQDKDS